MKTKNLKELESERVRKVIMAVLESPNKSAERAKLWFRLKKILEKLDKNNFGN